MRKVAPPGPNFTELLKQKILLNNIVCLAEMCRIPVTDYSEHVKWYSLAGNLILISNVFVVLSYFVCLCGSVKLP